MKRLFLVRHCESAGQDPSAPLTNAGQLQAMQLAEYLQTLDIDVLVSSPYARAQQSIAPLAERLRLPVEIDGRLAERVLSTELLSNWHEALRQSFAQPDLAWPGGESSRAAMARGRAAIEALLARPERNAVVVTHGNLMTLILHSFETRFGFETWERLSNPDVYCLTPEMGRVEISRTWADDTGSRTNVVAST